MFKTSIKLFLLTFIFYSQLSLSTFAMEIDNEDKNNNSITHRSPKNEEKSKDEEKSQDTPIGGIISFAGEKSPEGWLMCDGNDYSSEDYPELYKVIKTKYVPNGSLVFEANKKYNDKRFHVPDLKGRVIVGTDDKSVRVTSNNMIGNSGGEEKHQLTVDEMPNHSHRFGYIEHGISTGGHPCHDVRANDNNLLNQNTGGDTPHNNMQPYLVLNYIIKAEENNEINNLKKKIKDIEIQINTPTRLKARFKNSTPGWKLYAVQSWQPLTFNMFEGDERLKGNLSTIEIPEDGVYSLFAHYGWKANDVGDAAPYTAIAINTPNNHEGYFVQEYLHKGKELPVCGGINRVTRLKKGEKIMVSIHGQPHAEYSLQHFQFDIEKIN